MADSRGHPRDDVYRTAARYVAQKIRVAPLMAHKIRVAPLMAPLMAPLKAFNQDLSDWFVSLISSEPSDFRTSMTSWIKPQPVWGTCP